MGWTMSDDQEGTHYLTNGGGKYDVTPSSFLVLPSGWLMVKYYVTVEVLSICDWTIVTIGSALWSGPRPVKALNFN